MCIRDRLVFRYPEGTYDIKVRTYQHTVVIKNVELNKYTKTFITFDPQWLSNKKSYKLTNPDPILSEGELETINERTFFMDSEKYSTDSVWVENDGHRWLIRTHNGSTEPRPNYYNELRKSLLSITGLKAGKTILRINRDTFYFNFDPSQYYTITYGVLSNYPLPRYPLNREVITGSANKYNFDATLLARPLYFRSDRRKYRERKQVQAQREYEGLKWYETMRPYRYYKSNPKRQARIQLFNQYAKQVKYLWILNEEQPLFSYVNQGQTTPIEYQLKRGKYTLIAIDLSLIHIFQDWSH